MIVLYLALLVFGLGVAGVTLYHIGVQHGIEQTRGPS